MVKPQFELGRERVGKGGVVREPEERREALLAVADAAPRCRARRRGLRLVRTARAEGQPRDLHPLRAGGGGIARRRGGDRGGGA